MIREEERVDEMKPGHTGSLAIHGGPPVRTRPLPLEFPGIHHFDEEETEAALAVLHDRSPFRYYGVKLRGEVEQFERGFAAHLGMAHAVAVSSGTGALHTALSALGVEQEHDLRRRRGGGNARPAAVPAGRSGT